MDPDQEYKSPNEHASPPIREMSGGPGDGSRTGGRAWWLILLAIAPGVFATLMLFLSQIARPLNVQKEQGILYCGFLGAVLLGIFGAISIAARFRHRTNSWLVSLVIGLASFAGIVLLNVALTFGGCCVIMAIAN